MEFQGSPGGFECILPAAQLTPIFFHSDLLTGCGEEPARHLKSICFNNSRGEIQRDFVQVESILQGENSHAFQSEGSQLIHKS